jgi:hypothetical protein
MILAFLDILRQSTEAVEYHDINGGYVEVSHLSAPLYPERKTIVTDYCVGKSGWDRQAKYVHL